MKNLEFDDFVYQSIDGSKWNLDYDFEGETREYPFTWSMTYDEAERLYNLSPMKDGYEDVSSDLFFHDVHYRRDFHKWFVELAQEHLLVNGELVRKYEALVEYQQDEIRSLKKQLYKSMNPHVMEVVYQSKLNNNPSINSQNCSVRKQA